MKFFRRKKWTEFPVEEEMIDKYWGKDDLSQPIGGIGPPPKPKDAARSAMPHTKPDITEWAKAMVGEKIDKGEISWDNVHSVDDIDKIAQDMVNAYEEMYGPVNEKKTICPKCEQEKEIPDEDYICRECRYG